MDIPSKSNRREPIPHDKTKYKWRNQIERLFNKLKELEARRYRLRQDQGILSQLGTSNYRVSRPVRIATGAVTA